jgi:hypothetical protein
LGFLLLLLLLVVSKDDCLEWYQGGHKVQPVAKHFAQTLQQQKAAGA